MLRKIKITTRLTLGFGTILLLFFIFGFLSLSQLSDFSDTTTELYEHPFTVTNSLLDMKIHLLAIQNSVITLRETKDKAEIQRLKQTIVSDQRSFDFAIELVRERFLGDSSEVAKVMASTERWRIARDKEIELIEEGEKGPALAKATSEVFAARDEVFTHMGEVMDYSMAKAAEFSQEAQTDAKSYIYLIAIFLTATLALGTLLAIFVIRSIVRPLKAMVADLEVISRGDLTLDVPLLKVNDEIGSVTKSLKTMLRNFRNQIKETIDGVTLLAASASQITATGAELAAVASQTASSITETTVTADEVKQTAHIAMERTKEVADAAETTYRISQDGLQSIDETLAGIKAIKVQMESIAKSIISLNEQSQSIGDIIASVEDIAEQSNLLAVNAAIEAAKAGDQGRGFAVVAREIRSLAEQSKAATKQVKSILGDIQRAMQTTVMTTEQGNKIADGNYMKSEAVSAALRTLEDSIENTSQMAQQIMAANQQQFTGIDQVTLAMESIKEASRQNVDAARQLEDAARGIDSLSQKLKSLVERYKV
ncbi:MAG: methyl-accepting chemotaxis sensory transducer [Spirochaetes bacterium]|nr:MAG: methyl-accepting chemotaxis sensory transducer [Spirochaetota bacterium]